MIKPNIYPIKGNCGRIGYGYRFKTRRKNHKVEKRKAYRDIRRIGFDTSEAWELYTTIAGWLSDNVGGYFRKCGDPETWDENDLAGNPIIWGDPESTSKCFKADVARQEEFLMNLKGYLENSISEEFISFVLPRLKFFTKYVHGCPHNETFEGWKSKLEDMIDKFERGTYSTYFIIYFFALWD